MGYSQQGDRDFNEDVGYSQQWDVGRDVRYSDRGDADRGDARYSRQGDVGRGLGLGLYSRQGDSDWRDVRYFGHDRRRYSQQGDSGLRRGVFTRDSREVFCISCVGMSCTTRIGLQEMIYGEICFPITVFFSGLILARLSKIMIFVLCNHCDDYYRTDCLCIFSQTLFPTKGAGSLPL